MRIGGLGLARKIWIGGLTVQNFRPTQLPRKTCRQIRIDTVKVQDLTDHASIIRSGVDVFVVTVGFVIHPGTI